MARFYDGTKGISVFFLHHTTKNYRKHRPLDLRTQHGTTEKTLPKVYDAILLYNENWQEMYKRAMDTNNAAQDTALQPETERLQGHNDQSADDTESALNLDGTVGTQYTESMEDLDSTVDLQSDQVLSDIENGGVENNQQTDDTPPNPSASGSENIQINTLDEEDIMNIENDNKTIPNGTASDHSVEGEQQDQENGTKSTDSLHSTAVTASMHSTSSTEDPNGTGATASMTAHPNGTPCNQTVEPEKEDAIKSMENPHSTHSTKPAINMDASEHQGSTAPLVDEENRDSTDVPDHLKTLDSTVRTVNESDSEKSIVDNTGIPNGTATDEHFNGFTG